MFFTYCDLSSPFVKKLFEGMAMPIYDFDMPALFIIDFVEGRGFGQRAHVKAYHYPAGNPFEKIKDKLLITDPALISQFAQNYYNGELHATMLNENINDTFREYPDQKQLFDNFKIEKISAK